MSSFKDYISNSSNLNEARLPSNNLIEINVAIDTDKLEKLIGQRQVKEIMDIINTTIKYDLGDALVDELFNYNDAMGLENEFKLINIPPSKDKVKYEVIVSR